MDYLLWQSDLSAEQVFSGSQTFSYPEFLVDGSFIYLTSLAEDKNRSVLKRRVGEHEQVITPSPYHLQTQISEYGGKPFWLSDDYLIFANRQDQCLYSQTIVSILDGDAEQPQAISSVASNEVWRYTDVHVLQSGGVLFIAEHQNTLDHSEKSFIGYLPKVSPKPDVGVIRESVLKPIILVDGADFYSNLVVDESNGKLAWVQWDHPNMPWDNVDLHIAQFAVTPSAAIDVWNIENVDLSDISKGQKSICQLLFSHDGKLFFSADFSGEKESSWQNYWQVYCRSARTGELRQVTSQIAEFGYPHWVYGDSRISQLDDDTVVAIASTPEGDSLLTIKLDDLSITEIFAQQSTIQHLSSDRSGRCVFVCLPNDDVAKILSLRVLQSKSLTDLGIEILNKDAFSEQILTHLHVSRAETITFPTKDVAVAHGFFYRPMKQNFSQDYDEDTFNSNKPPLIVMVHGGPTARAYGHFDLQKQFWTSRGFALLDVNHRGSSGYGRSFRDALYGCWGKVDASDIIDGIDHLIAQGLVDPNRVCIRGKSAGGYAVLRALTEYPSRFKAGANYYGIGNLVTLAQSTHKFEKYYTDRLIGETFVEVDSISEESLFYQRSPINRINQLNSAMIIFQGLLDKVVPPSVAQELVDVLENQAQNYSYIEYVDEGHGFRQAANNIDAWNRELAFYREVLAY